MAEQDELSLAGLRRQQPHDLVGDLLARDRQKKFLPWGRAVSITLIVFCVVNTAFIGARNGWIGLGMLAFSGVIVHYINGWQKVGKKALLFLPILLALLVAGAWTSWKTDARWNSLKETLPVGPNFPGAFRDIPFGQGTVEFVHCFRTLHELNYHGPFLIEMWTEKAAQPLDEIAKARQWVGERLKLGGYESCSND